MRLVVGWIAILMVLVFGCTPPGVGTTTLWSEPGVPRQRFHRVMTVFVSQDDELRQDIELDLARRIGNGTPAYLVISRDASSDEETVRRCMRRSDFDAVLVTRLVSVRRTATGALERPATPEGSFWGHWRGAWSTAESPDHAPVVAVESALYSLDRNRLLWAGRSGALTRTKARTHVTDVVNEVTDEMRRQRLF